MAAALAKPRQPQATQVQATLNHFEKIGNRTSEGFVDERERAELLLNDFQRQGFKISSKLANY